MDANFILRHVLYSIYTEDIRVLYHTIYYESPEAAEEYEKTQRAAIFIQYVYRKKTETSRAFKKTSTEKVTLRKRRRVEK